MSFKFSPNCFSRLFAYSLGLEISPLSIEYCIPASLSVILLAKRAALLKSAPIILIGFGGLIVYFTWYWKKGPGNEWLNSLDSIKNANSVTSSPQFGMGMNKTQTHGEQIDSTIQFQMPTSSPSPPLAKICPYCQTQNPHTSSHCELCLEKIPDLKVPSNNYNSPTNEIKVRDNNNLKPQINNNQIKDSENQMFVPILAIVLCLIMIIPSVANEDYGNAALFFIIILIFLGIVRKKKSKEENLGSWTEGLKQFGRFILLVLYYIIAGYLVIVVIYLLSPDLPGIPAFIFFD